jgi:hypothetical protein
MKQPPPKLNEFSDFACDYLVKARTIASISIAVTFIVLDRVFKFGLPVNVYIALAIFEALINQPFKFLRKLFKAKDKLLLATNLIDIIAISIAVYFAGGITFIFSGFPLPYSHCIQRHHNWKREGFSACGCKFNSGFNFIPA